MNMKYIVFFIILLVVFLIPVNAFDIQDLDKNTVTYINGKSVITTSIVSTNVISDSRMKKDLENIDKIVIKVNNKTVNTIKKGKNWNKNKHYPTSIINRKTIVKGNLKGKTVSILTYNSKNKLIKSKINKIKTIDLYSSKLIKSKYPKGSKLNQNQAKTILIKKSELNGMKIKYRGYYYLYSNLLWSFQIMNEYNTIISVDDKFGTLEFDGL